MKNIKKIAKDTLAMARGTLVVDECVKSLTVPISRLILILTPYFQIGIMSKLVLSYTPYFRGRTR